jgi:hypothetical protein
MCDKHQTYGKNIFSLSGIFCLDKLIILLKRDARQVTHIISYSKVFSKIPSSCRMFSACAVHFVSPVAVAEQRRKKRIFPLHAEYLKTVYDGLIHHYGMKVLFFIRLASVEMNSDSTADAVIVANKAGLTAENIMSEIK